MGLVERPLAACLLWLAADAALARLVLDLGVVHRKGIDTGLVLQSDIHTKEEVLDGRGVEVAFKDGPRILVRAGFDDGFPTYGPSDLVGVEVRAVAADGGAMEAVGETKARVPLGGRREFGFRDGGSHLVEVSVVPRVR